MFAAAVSKFKKAVSAVAATVVRISLLSVSINQTQAQQSPFTTALT